MKVFGYARKSPDDKEGTESSILNQTKMIEKLCKEREWNLVDIFIDKNISGSDRERKSFNDMKRRAILEKVEIIVVKDQDRFARDSAFFSDTLHDLNIYGVRVFSILKNNFLSHEDLGDVITSVVDADYIKRSRQKTAKSYSDKQEAGLPPFVAPFGYRFPKRKGAIKEWLVKEKEAEIIKQVVADYILKVPLKETLNRLKINKALYYRIIGHAKRGTYSGWIVYTKKFKDSTGRIAKTEEVRYKGNHQAIVSEKEWQIINTPTH